MMNLNAKNIVWYALLAGVYVGGYYVYKVQMQSIRSLEMSLESIAGNPVAQELSSQETQRPKMLEKTIVSGAAWRPIQERVKDTVAQIFTQVAEIDIREPYKTPAQYKISGSGFFINDQGYLITNAHVVSNAKSVYIQIPSFGKRIIDTSVIGFAPDYDLALLRVDEEGLALIRKELGAVPFLKLGDSDLIRRSDEVLALGYPLGQESLKSTTGVISGRESNLIQMSAAINPGSSGGPLLNLNGEVVGINRSGVVEAQNVGYIIPVNDLKTILPHLYKEKLLRKPFLGVLYNNATDALTNFLGNPMPGGCYVTEVVKNSTLYKAGVKRGDMIYEINGHRLDMYGEMNVPWSEDKINITDYVSRLSLGDKVHVALYRNGVRKEITAMFSQMELPPIRKVYPMYEDIDYETIAGLVVMELTMNHIAALVERAPGLANYADYKNQSDSVLVISHVFPTAYIARIRTVSDGTTINEVNGQKVRTLSEFREAIKKSVETGYLTLKVSDNVYRVSDNVFVVVPFDRVLSEESQLAFDYRYRVSGFAQQISLAWSEGHSGSKNSQINTVPA